MDRLNKNIIIIGIILLIIVVFMWSNTLSGVTVGKSYGSVFFGNSAAQAAAQRANINTSYGLFVALILIGTPVLAYYFNKNNSKNNPSE